MSSPISHYEDFYTNLDRELSSIDNTYKSTDSKKINVAQKSFNKIIKLNPLVICSIIFVFSNIFLFFLKPGLIRKKDKEGKKIKKVAIPKLILFSIIITLPFAAFYMMKFRAIVK